MHILFVVALFIGAAVIAFGLFIALTILIIRVIVNYYLYRILAELMSMEWKPFSEIVASGIPRHWCVFHLLMLHSIKEVEMRLLDGKLPPEETDDVEIPGMISGTLDLYEFRLIRRGGRRQRKRFKFKGLKLFPGLEPAPA